MNKLWIVFSMNTLYKLILLLRVLCFLISYLKFAIGSIAIRRRRVFVLHRLSGDSCRDIVRADNSITAHSIHAASGRARINPQNANKTLAFFTLQDSPPLWQAKNHSSMRTSVPTPTTLTHLPSQTHLEVKIGMNMADIFLHSNPTSAIETRLILKCFCMIYALLNSPSLMLVLHVR